MTSGATVTWLARARAADGRELTLRVRTSGHPPSADDVGEEIVEPFACGSIDARAATIEAAAVDGGLRAAVGSLAFAPPVRPSKILAVGRNFHAHAAELGNE